MALRTYIVKLTGTDGGAFNTVDVSIAGTDIYMTSTDGEVTWINKGTVLDTINPVSLFFSVYAINGTSWDIEIAIAGTAQICYRGAGITGEKLISRQNKRVPDYSERKVEITC